MFIFFFFFNDTATTEIYTTRHTLSLHDALPINRVGGENWTMISSLGEAAELLDEADHPALGIQFDSWHVWNTPNVLDEIAEHAGRFIGVHIADWREPTRK